jgi:hypothetical protein
MKTLSLFVLLSTLGLVAFSGCTRSTAETGAPVAASAPAAHYKAGHGIQLSDAAARFIALETVDVTVRDVGSNQAVMVVPAAALLRTVKGNFVFVANGGWFLRTPVQVGANDEAWFEVRDGLYEGDTVVARGMSELWLAELQAVNGGVGCADGH